MKNARLDTDKDIEAYRQAAERLQKVRDEIAKRDIDMRGSMTESRAKEVMKSLDESSYADIKNATETMKKMQAQLEPGTNKWKTYGKQIADATNYLKKWDDQAKRTQMLQATKGDLGKMTDSDLQQQLRYWDGIVNGIGRTNVAVNQYRKVLETLQSEQEKRTGRVMTKVESGDLGGSIAEMQNRLKLLQDYRNAMVPDKDAERPYEKIDSAIEKLTQGIKASQAGFLSYADAMKQAEGLADGSFKGSISDLDKMKKVLEEYKGTLATTDTAGIEKVNGLLDSIANKQKELQTGYMSYTQAMDKAGQVMDGSFEGSIADLEKLQKVLTEYRSSLDVKDSEGLKGVDTRLESITKKMQELRPGFLSFQDALAKAKQVADGTFEGTIEDLDKLQKVLKEGMSAELNIGSDEDVQKLKESTALLDGIVQKQKELAEINKRENAESTVERVRKNISGVSPAELEEAIRLAKELQKMNGTSTIQYKNLSSFINEAEAQLKKWNDQVKRSAMSSQLVDVTKLSKLALEEQKKYWQAMVDGASEGDAALDRYRENLQKVTEEETRRIQQMAGQTIADYNTGNWDKTIGETREAVKQLQSYRDTLKTVGDSNALLEVDKVIEGLTLKTKQAEAGFLSFEDALQKAADIDHFDGTLEDLEKIQKVLKEGMAKELNLSDPNDLQTLKDVTALLDSITDKRKELAEINKRENAEAAVRKVRTNIAGSSPAEIEEAIKAAKELQKMNGTSAAQYKSLAKFITEAEAQLKTWNDQAKQSVMQSQLTDVTKLSKLALEEHQKFWKAAVDGAKEGDAALTTYRANLEKTTNEERRRLKESLDSTKAEQGSNDGKVNRTVGDIKELIKDYERLESLTEATDAKGLKEIRDVVGDLRQQLKESEAGFISFEDAMKEATDLEHFDGSIDRLEQIQKVLKEGMATKLNLSDPNDLQTLKDVTALLDSITDKRKELADINKREQAETKVTAVSTNLAGSSPAEIEEAIKAAKELQKMNGTSATQYKSLAQFIGEAEAQLKTWNDQVKHALMEAQFKKLATLSKNALEEQQKYWQSVYDNAEKGTAKYIQAERKLADINQTLTDRKSDEAGAIMGNLQGSSVDDIERAIKMTEELMKAHSRGSQEYEIYAEEIKKAKECLQSYVDLDKQVDMEDKWSKLRTLSTDALAEQKKYWQEMVNGAQQGSQELQDYQDKLKAVVEEERMRLDNQATKVLADPTNFSSKEVQDAVKSYEQIRDAQRLGSGEWEYYNKKIEETRATLKKYNDEAKATVMEGRLGGLTTASTASLAEQKKFWQEMVNGAERGTQALKDYQENLDKVLKEEKTRIQNAAQQTITDYNTGNRDKTIGETKEAIKQLQEYRNTLNQKTDAIALADVDEVLAKLTEHTKQAEQGFISLEAALLKVSDVTSGNFDGSIEDLQKLKKRLEEIRDTEINLNAPDAKGQLIQIGSALDAVDKKIDEVNRGSFNLENTLKHLDKASMKDLNRAAEELKKQINGASTASATFVERSKELRAVNKRIEEAKELWKEKENIITKTAKRLASYVLVYAGFNEIAGRLKEVARANLELSDSLADIQKTTGLSAESVAHLSDQINAIDTRSAQKELHDLAYEAGKLGISAEEDVLAFVRAGNQLLVALGEDLGGAEAVRQLMKVNAVLGETQKLGVEKALLATGSAINEISQTSRASAGPIADMVKRIGAIGAASNLTMDNLVALAGTADAMGQSAEVAGTAFNKFLGTLQTSSTDVAYSLGLDPDRLKQLLSDEETAIYGIIEVFEKMNLMGEMADLSPIMKDLGSEGARMTQVLTTMAGGVEELKAQVFTSKQAFEEATSVTNEYNIKNESAAAILERMGNNLREMVTNSTVVNALKDFLQWAYYLPNALERNRGLLFAIRVILYQIAAVSLTKLVAMIGCGMTGALTKATKAWKMFNLEAANSILLGGDKHGMWQRNTLRALTFANGINKVRIAFAALGRVIAANPIFFIGTAIALVTSAIRTLTENTNKAAKAQAEFDAAVRKEQFELDNLRIRIEKANSANGDK